VRLLVRIRKSEEMKKIALLILLSVSASLLAYGGDSVFDEICAALNDKTNVSQTYLLDHKYRRQPVSGRGYVLSVDKDAMGGDVSLKLSSLRSRFDDSVVYVVVHLTRDYFSEALKYRVGDSVYFSGTFRGVSTTDKQIVIDNASISRFHEIIPRER
jgi:hypothetical protein